MALYSKPIFVLKPNEQYYCGPGFVPYFYEEELKEIGVK